MQKIIQLFKEILSPNFQQQGDFRNWKNFVPESMKNNWSELSPQEQASCFWTAQQNAKMAFSISQN